MCTQAASDCRSNGRLTRLNGFGKSIDSLVEKPTRRVELLEYLFGQTLARDPAFRLVRIAQIFGQQVKLLENLLYVRLDDGTGPARHDRRPRHPQHVCNR